MGCHHRFALLGGALLLSASVAFGPATAGAVGRERAAEQIPELMGRILDSQEEIREREGEYAPVIQRYNERLAEARDRIQTAGSEDDAAVALVDYVETYAARLEAQEEGLEGIRSAVVRMRAYRLQRTRDELARRDMAGVVLYDPVNVRYATGSRNMSIHCMHTPSRFAFVPAEGPVTLFEYRTAQHLVHGLETIHELRPAVSWNYFSAGPNRGLAR